LCISSIRQLFLTIFTKFAERVGLELAKMELQNW